MPTIVHFEIPADDIGRAQKFYRELFGWQIEKFPGSGPEEYWVFSTGGGMGEAGVGGGMMKRQMPQQQITVYFDVPSMDEYLAKVRKLGGQVVVPKTAIPEMGYFAVCLDTENNGFGLWETNPAAK